MKIKLVRTVPVAQKHGMVEGRVLDVLSKHEADDGSVWVQGEGERVRIWVHEYEQVKEVR